MKRRRLLNAGLGAAIVVGRSGKGLAAAPALMEPLDCGRSFLQGKWAENRVRFWIESRTRIIDPESAVLIDYHRCAS